MREIKFRGKRESNNEMVYFDFCGMYRDINGIEIEPKRFIRDCEYKIKPETIGQSTGMKDKNGKEIYEGDLLSVENGTYIYKVVWDDRWARFVYKNTYDGINESIFHVKEFEVVGNIYDNPELLEAK